MDKLKNAIAQVYDNPTGFGPGKTISPVFEDQLFQPYYKTADRPWHVSDWATKSKGRSTGGIVSGFAFKADEDPSSFALVEGKPAKPAYRRIINRNLMNKSYQSTQNRGYQKKGPGAGGYQRGGNQNRGGPRTRGGGPQGRGGQRNNGGRYRNMFNKEEFQRESSVVVDPNWQLVEEIQFNELDSAPIMVEGETLSTMGSLELYKSSLNRVTTRGAIPVPSQPVHAYNANASADPVMQAFAGKKTARVYASEQVLSLLMASPHTVHAWDVLVTKTPHGIFIDARPDSAANTLHSLETVSEYLPAEPENINSAVALSREATAVAAQFVQMAVSVGEAPQDQTEPSPAAQNAPAGETPASLVYRYRKFDLGDGMTVVARTSLAAYAPDASGNNQMVAIKAFNESDPRAITGSIDWRERMDSQPGAVLAAEMKNNTTRVVRAMAETFLSGADTVRLGWLTRASARDNTRHVVLGVSTYEPKLLATAMRVLRSELWSTLRTILDFINEQEDGKFILARDAMRPVIRLFSVKNEVFDAATGKLKEIEE